MRKLNGCKLFALIATFYASLMSASVNAMSEDSEMTVDTLVAEHISDKYLAYCFIDKFDSSASVKSITRLDCGNRQIKNINGLEHLEQLNDLKLYTNQISDLSPLANLTQLSFLSLHGNNVNDLAPLKNLSSLKGLVLSNNLIESLLPLESLSKLKTLKLGSNNITDLSPLAHLKELELVTLINNNEITCVDTSRYQAYDYKDLAFTCLKKGAEYWPLDFPDGNLAKCLASWRYYDISDVTKLGCGNGEYNVLSISDLEGIQAFTELAELRLKRQSATDVLALENLTELSLLGFDNHSNFNLSSLSTLIQLTHLEIGGSELNDLSFLSTLSQLETLTITAPLTAGIDLAPIASLVNLQHLVFDFSKGENPNQLYSDVSPLANLSKLNTLDLGNLEVDNISALSPITQLKKLSLTGPKQSELNAFSEFKELWFLSIKGGGITDISGLKSLENLYRIEILNKNTLLECMGESFIVDYSTEYFDLENNELVKDEVLPTTEFILSHGGINEKCWAPELTVEFALEQVKDESLRTCISQNVQDNALSSPFELTHLSCPSLAIQSLTGLTLFSNIFYLDLSDNLLTDIYLLNDLKNIYEVNLSQNEQLNCIENKNRGEILFSQVPQTCLVSKIADVPYSDKYLQACIEQVSKENNWQLVDEVSSLNCSDGRIDNIEALEFFSNLGSLNLAESAVRPLSVIGKLDKLKHLEINNIGADGLSSLSSLTNLESLSLGVYTWLSEDDLDSLVNLNKLEHFSADIHLPDHIEYLSSFGFFDKLKSLDLTFKFENTELNWSNLAVLNEAVGLEELSLSGGSFTDLYPLYNLTNLTSLAITEHRSRIACLTDEIHQISGTYNIRSQFSGSYQDIPELCWASYKPLNDILPLIEDTNLRACISASMTTQGLNLGKEILSLSCVDRDIKSLSGLAYLSSLTELDLSDNSISDINELSALIGLKHLNLVNNLVPSLAALSPLYDLVDFKIKPSHLSRLDVSMGCSVYDDSISYFDISADCLDIDYDNDGIANELDNCPLQWNKNQVNIDNANDGGDVCDRDDDNDTLPDEYEIFYGLDPLVADGDADFDNDGLSNKQEYELLSLPTVPDSDQDGIIDGYDDSPYSMTIFELLNSPAFILSNSIKECLWAYDNELPILDIKTLDCSHPLFSLIGIDYFKNLDSLHLSYGPVIKDVEILNKLSQLRTLSLFAEEVSDFSPLEKLQHIESLVIFDNKSSVLDHVAKLNQVSALTLNVLPSDDLSLLGGMSKLSELNLLASDISLVGDLSGLSHLEILSMNADFISDLSGLSYLVNLKSLSLSAGLLPKDLSPIKQLKQLNTLSMPSIGINNLDFVKGLRELRELSVPYNHIIDLRPLVNLNKLESLDVSNNPNVDLSSLGRLHALTTLELSGIPLSSISPLINMTNLSSLSLSLDDLLNLDELALLSQLSKLSIHADTIARLSFLDSLSQLSELRILAKPPQDMVSISNLESLQVLQIYDRSAQITSDDKVEFDLAIVANLKHLHTLGFESLNVTNEPQLKNLIKLTDLSIRKSDTYSACFGWYDVNGISYADIHESCLTVDDKNMSISRLLGHIPDIALSDCVKENAEQNGWSTANEISSLFCYYRNNLENLEGIEWLTSLQTLNLGGNQISDLSPLADLTELEQVYLWSNPELSSLAPLYNLPKLYELSLDPNNPWSGEELVNFPHLKSLTLIDGENIDISVLARLTELTSLNFWNQIPRDLSFLSSLTNLNSLHLDARDSSVDSDGVSLHVLSDLSGLTELSLTNMSISDINSLADLTSLRYLQLSGNEISDISTLSKLGDLSELYLASNSLVDISVLSKLSNLSTLNLNSNAITDISALSNLAKLKDLSLGGNDLTNISGLESLSNLASLDLRGSKELDYTALIPLPTLTKLNLSDNYISDINFLVDFTNLTGLSLAQNEIVDISVLHNLTALTDLDLQDNLIVDVSVLGSISQTANITLYGNPIMACAEGYDGDEKVYNALPVSCWSADTDRDGISNAIDNCPEFTNAGQWDKDQDGLGNECDDDIDGDGFSNKEEETVGSKVWDFESTPESILLDDDGDGINNLEDNCIVIANPQQWDKDKDGLGNECDDDIDGDGVSNLDEEAEGTLVWNEFSFLGQSLEKDRDQDGFANEADNCPDILNQGQWDNDKDGLGNECDDDIDGDGYPNQYEIDAGSLAWDANSVPQHNALLDDDYDTIVNGTDNCPNISNPGQWDKDKDGIGNECDNDIDGDGASNKVEIDLGTSPWDPDSRPRDYDLLDNDFDNIVNGLDNCPNIANPKQYDFDEDNIGNVCDDDADGDGFTYQEEIDSGTDPKGPQSFPLPSDMDADGYLDSEDTCPTTYGNPADFDNDGLGNLCDDDIDGDGFSNTEERERSTDVWDASSFPQ